MVSDNPSFRRVNLGDLIEESTVRLSSSDSCEIPVYGVDRSLGLTAEAKYTSKNLSRYKLLRPGMFAYNPMRLNIGSIGYCSKRHQPGLVSPDYVVFKCKEDRLLPDYLAYVIKGDEWTRWTESAGVGSVRVRIYYRELTRLELTIPPIAEQRNIADLLGAIDDRIELNHKMNEMLESMAQAVFKSWFVDFDPVVAKSEGRQPEGMDAETAKLFPDSFEESEIGRIPKEWKVGTISDLATLSRDTIAPLQYPDEVFDHYSIPAFDEGRVPKTEIGNTIMSNKFTVHDNCVLLSKLNPRIPRVWMPDRLDNKRALCSTEFLVSLPKENVSKEYLYLLFTSAQFCERFATFVTGTSGSHQRVKPESLLMIETPLPQERLVRAFTALVAPLLATTGANIRQTHELAEIRDALLPQLLSGELTVPANTVCK